MVDRHDFAGQLVRPAAGEWRHHRADPHPFSGQRDGGEGDPWVRNRHGAKEQVVPDEEAVPTRRFSIGSQGRQDTGIVKVCERWNVDAELHQPKAKLARASNRDRSPGGVTPPRSIYRNERSILKPSAARTPAAARFASGTSTSGVPSKGSARARSSNVAISVRDPATPGPSRLRCAIR